MAGKKRKLPRDLSEAEVLVRTEKLSISTITAARPSLSEVTLSDIGVAPLRSLSPEEFMAWLVARFGVKESKKICSVAASIPPTLTSAQRDRYIQKHLGWVSLIAGLDSPLERGTGAWDWTDRLERGTGLIDWNVGLA